MMSSNETAGRGSGGTVVPAFSVVVLTPGDSVVEAPDDSVVLTPSDDEFDAKS